MYICKKDSSVLPHYGYVYSKRKFARYPRLELLNNIAKLIGRMDIPDSEPHDLFLSVPQHPADSGIGGNEPHAFNIRHQYAVHAVVE